MIQLTDQSKIKILLRFWKVLKKVKKLTFSARTKSKEGQGWNGKGQGDVISAKKGLNSLIFNEKGTWHTKQGTEIHFNNAICWTLNRTAGVISLEHLRYGYDHPVFLVHLAPSGKQSLSSLASHLCEKDAYFGELHFDLHSLRLNWRVIGPKKNEEMDYYYS